MRLGPAKKIIVLILTFLLFPIWLCQPIFAQSGSLENLFDIISDETPNATSVLHEVSFQLPASSYAIISTDYIQINLASFSQVTAPTSVLGTYTGTPTFSVSGNVARVTGISVLPGKTITVRGITARNPINDFTVTVSVTQNEAGTLIKNIRSVGASGNPGIYEVSANVEIPQSRLQISGFTQPQTFTIFTEGSNVIGTDAANGIGVFSKLFQSLTPGEHFLTLYGIDTEDRGTAIINLSLNLPAFTTTNVTDLLLSPTSEISGSEFEVGEDIYATGSAYPGSAITIFTDSPLRTYNASASAGGDWTVTINDTTDYTPGDYRLYTLTQAGSLQSLTSPMKLFSIVSSSSTSSGTSCGNITQGDLNCDDSINLTDFSILMYYWGTVDATADMNDDGVVNLTDFSIMMYYWGT